VTLRDIDTDELKERGRLLSHAIQGVMRAGGGCHFSQKLLVEYRQERREIVAELHRRTVEKSAQ
jgi:hypothetical protein